MTVELIQSETAFQALKKDWNLLLENSASDVPFLRHEFLAAWWQTLGGGEWPSGKLAILLHRDPDGRLDGIAPFFTTGERVLLLGSYEIADYLDIIAHPEHLAAVIADFFAFLAGNDFPAWERLDLYNLREDAASLPHLVEGARLAGFNLEQEILQPAPFLGLPNSWETYLESLKDRYRRDIERKLAKAENYFLPISWYIVDQIQDLDQEMDDFLALMAENPDKEKFLTSDMIRHMKNAARAAYQSGWLQLAFLRVGDIKAAGYLNFDYANRIWVYNSGINSLFENISPGWVLLGKLIQHAIQEGKGVLDFMRGNETYKYQFGGEDLKVLRLQITK